jgi:hypothetical protein
MHAVIQCGLEKSKRLSGAFLRHEAQRLSILETSRKKALGEFIARNHASLQTAVACLKRKFATICANRQPA